METLEFSISAKFLPFSKKSLNCQITDFLTVWGSFEALFQRETAIDLQKVYSITQLIRVLFQVFFTATLSSKEHTAKPIFSFLSVFNIVAKNGQELCRNCRKNDKLERFDFSIFLGEIEADFYR